MASRQGQKLLQAAESYTNNEGPGKKQAKKLFNNFLESYDMSSAFANSSGSGVFYQGGNNRAQSVVQNKKNSLSGSRTSNNRQDVVTTMKSYEQPPIIAESRVPSNGTQQSKSINSNPFKLTSTIIETMGGQPIENKARNNVVINRSFCYDAAGHLLNGSQNNQFANQNEIFSGQQTFANGQGAFNNLVPQTANMNQSFETKNRQSLGVNLTVFNSINYLTNSAGKQEPFSQSNINNSANRKPSSRMPHSSTKAASSNSRAQSSQQNNQYPVKSQSGIVTTSALNNSRNMIINLNQMKSQPQQQNLTKAQFMQALSSQGIKNFSVNRDNYSTIDYITKPSQKQNFRKKEAVSRSQVGQPSASQNIQNFAPKDSTKRSGIDGGAVSIMSSIVPQSQKQTINYKSSGFNTSSVASKSASKKRQSSNSRNNFQQQPQFYNMRNIDKIRASSHLGQHNDQVAQVTEFDTVLSRDGPSDANHSSLSNLNQQAIKLVIKEDDDIVVSRSGVVNTEPNDSQAVRPNSRNVAKKSYQTVSSVLQQPQAISKAEFLRMSRQELGSVELDNNSFPKNVYKNQGPSQNRYLDKNSSLLSDFSNQPLNLRDSQESIQILKAKEQEVRDLETKLAKKLKESQSSKVLNAKTLDTKGDIFLDLIDELSSKNPGGYQQFLLRLKQGISSLFKEHSQLSRDSSEEITEIKSKFDNQEKVMKELRKQVACYKTEISQMQKMEEYLNADNYQKLVTEYNQLYDHYKGVKSINKKIRTELKQSNERERTFLKLLKKTSEYGAQAAKLEVEYDRLIKEDLRMNGGMTLENLVIDSAEKRFLKPEIIDMGRGIKIPKLDFSSIYIQREIPSQQANGANKNKEQGEGDNQTSDSESQMTDPHQQDAAADSSFSEEDDQVAVVNAGDHYAIKKSKVPQVDQFENEKQMFKMKMLKASKI